MKIHVEAVRQRIHELEELLGSDAVLQDRDLSKKYSQEHSQLSEIFQLSEQQNTCVQTIRENTSLLQSETDPEIVDLLQEDILAQQASLAKAEKKLAQLLLPPDDSDDYTTIVELRAGAGGQEAALFVADCVRMYEMYAGSMGWKIELLSMTPSDLGGYKEYIMAVSGKKVWRFMQYEAGTHRVQRVPETEAQGRVHTSTITIAVLQEPDDDTDVVISEQDLRIDTTRSSGAGGQHVNKTDSAVRLTHLPTGLVVFCQEERSQHKNKEKAMRYLKVKVRELEMRKRKSEEDAKRLEQVGSGDRSEKIRTYNFPQNRITDHRVNITRYDLDRVMNGDLEDFSQALVQWGYSSVSGALSPWILEL